MARKFGPLTEPSTTTPMSVTHIRRHVFSITVTNIDTNVVLRVESSFDKVTWSNIDSDDLTLTANDTYNLIVVPDYPVDFIRLNWVSELGGTSAILNVTYLGVGE